MKLTKVAKTSVMDRISPLYQAVHTDSKDVKLAYLSFYRAYPCLWKPKITNDVWKRAPGLCKQSAASNRRYSGDSHVTQSSCHQLKAHRHAQDTHAHRISVSVGRDGRIEVEKQEGNA